MTHHHLTVLARRIEEPVRRLSALVTACAGGARDGHGNPIGRPDELFHRILATTDDILRCLHTPTTPEPNSCAQQKNEAARLS